MTADQPDLTATADALRRAAEALEAVRHNPTLDQGKSILDALNRIDAQLQSMGTRLEVLDDRVKNMEEAAMGVGRTVDRIGKEIKEVKDTVAYARDDLMDKVGEVIELVFRNGDNVDAVKEGVKEVKDSVDGMKGTMEL